MYEGKNPSTCLIPERSPFSLSNYSRNVSRRIGFQRRYLPRRDGVSMRSGICLVVHARTYVLAFTAHSLLVSCKNCFSSADFDKSRSPFKTGKVSTRPIWEKSLALSLRSNVMIGSIFPSRPRKTNYLSRFLNVGIMTQSFGRGRRGRSQK